MKQLVLLIVLLVGTPVFAQECQDPESLPDNLKKAYYQLKELEKEIEGMKVKITCRTKTYVYKETEKEVGHDTIVLVK